MPFAALGASKHVYRLWIGYIQIEIAKNYGTVEWHEDLKLCLMQAGVDDKSVVFLFNDTQVRLLCLVCCKHTLKSMTTIR